MSRAKTELESFLVYGIDEQNRKVYFGTDLVTSDPDYVGGFNQSSCEFAIRSIERMIAANPKTPIEIHMNSYGGDPYSMLALYDVIQAATCQIKFFGKGAIMSAATWIMACCDERHLYPNTTVMVHDGWEATEANVTDFQIFTEESIRLRTILHNIYADNSKMPVDFWEKVCQRDLYLTAEETIALGLADRIVHPKKRGNYRKIRQHHLGQKIDKRKMKRLADKLLKRVHLEPLKEIVINAPKVEPIDNRLTIEPLEREPDEASND